MKYSANLLNAPWYINESYQTSTIVIFSPRDYIIEPNQVLPITIEGMLINLSEDVYGVPFIRSKGRIHKDLVLYHPKVWKEIKSDPQITLFNNHHEVLSIDKGDYLCSVKFITKQFYDLESKHRNLEKGLRSALVTVKITNKIN